MKIFKSKMKKDDKVYMDSPMGKYLGRVRKVYQNGNIDVEYITPSKSTGYVQNVKPNFWKKYK